MIPLTLLRKIFLPPPPLPTVFCQTCTLQFNPLLSRRFCTYLGCASRDPPGCGRFIHQDDEESMVFFGWGFLETSTFATGILGGVLSPTQEFYVFSRDFCHDGTVGNKRILNVQGVTWTFHIFPSSLQISRKKKPFAEMFKWRMKLPVRKRWGTHFDHLEASQS